MPGKLVSASKDFYAWLKGELNFFRIHLLFFLIVPLLAAIIFWAANGRFHIAFIDALFLCYSALTVTGLSTVNLSTCTAFQQAILFFLMCIGNVTVVAWVMVLIRKHYFRIHFEKLRGTRNRLYDILIASRRKRPREDPERSEDDPQVQVEAPSRQGTMRQRKDRMSVSEGIGAAIVGSGAGVAFGVGLTIPQSPTEEGSPSQNGFARFNMDGSPLAALQTALPMSHAGHALVESPVPTSPRSIGFERTFAVTHEITSSPVSVPTNLPSHPATPLSGGMAFPKSPAHIMRRRQGIPAPKRRTTVYQSPKVFGDVGQREKDKNFGGFPGPFQLFHRFSKTYLPQMHDRVRNLVKPAPGGRNDPKSGRLAEQFSNLIIGRNSDFFTEELTDEELEDLGGLEYRALRLLSYLVALYFVGTILLGFILVAPWLSTTGKYDDVFNNQPRLVNKSWFVAFQMVGSYTGGGMSLVDQGMVPFQQAYLMIFSMIFVILAGNHGLPILWILTKFVQDDSPADRTLHFLLDHPRRCFLYLFPSHVTWFLSATLCGLTALEWAAFIVLDLGLEVTESIPPWPRAVAGLFQSFAVRASGFPIVSISALAPSFQFLCIVMMYIAVYPVALSIRSTNVYEEMSLGVFEAPPEDEDEEPALGENHGTRTQRIGQYFGWHLRRQVAYDIWWLVWGIFLICVIERGKIMDEVNAPWFNVFRIVFELVSAFGGIGLTLGIPTDNFSFSGSFGPLSKLVVIVIMVRGRHRGLPVAIDRAILLPADLVPAPPSAPNNHATQATQVVEKVQADPVIPDNDNDEDGLRLDTTDLRIPNNRRGTLTHPLHSG